MAEQSINVPQVLVFLLVTFLAVRWYTSKPSGGGGSGGGTRPGGNSAARISPATIDTIAAMFPQLSRRDIAWDLAHNGGNAAATTERVLSGRGLNSAPASFNPPALRAPAQTPARAPVAPKPTHPDLITRYNLADKLTHEAGTTATETEANKAPVKAWSQDRNERQANLQRKREEMILAARRKMEAKEREKSA